MSKASEAAYKFANDTVHQETVSADEAATHIENLLTELSQYQKVVDAAQKYKEANAMYNYSGKREAKDALYKTLSQIKETNDG